MNNSLAEVRPELIAEWSDRNLPLTPDSVTFGSNKKVWWKGACGHEWETSIKARSSGEKCPICSGARVVAGINDLSTLKPELASEWSEENEIKPTEVSIGSHKKVIWKCKLGHEWIATVKSRTINRSGSTSRSAQTGQTVPFTRALITDFHSFPHFLQCHHTFFLDFAFTSFGFRGKFFSDHSSAICGCVLFRSFFPLINV